MKFTKMQGLGNDYIYVNCFRETVNDPAALSIKVSDRHFGIGSDGLILIKPSENADFAMEMYNADGSRGKMCGNGIRCVGKYVYDHGMTRKTSIDIETDSGIKHLNLTIRDGKVLLVRVDMGSPVLEPDEIPVRSEKYPVMGERLDILGRTWDVTCVSMGNPHCVTVVDDPDALDLEQIGPLFENHPIFPDRVNTEFISVTDPAHIRMRVWERGSGETLACGTGACASAVACMLNGLTDDEVIVSLKGGDLGIYWDRQENRVYMTGPAVTVFEGEIGGPLCSD